MERQLFRTLIDLGDTRDTKSCLREALAIVVAMSGADRGFIELVDPATRERYRLARGFSDRANGEIESRATRRMVAQALGRKRTLKSARDGVVCTPVGEPHSGVVWLQGSALDAEAERLCELLARHVGGAYLDGAHAARSDRDITPAVREKLNAKGLIGQSTAFVRMLKQLLLLAPSDLTVLLTGPSGVGKTVLAKFIADNSPRAAGPFVDFNCAALPDALVESLLFGVCQGAHSTATRDNPGIIASADGGTLFLDEVADLSSGAQAKLLQFIETKHFWRLGAPKPTCADVRLVAATNADLSRAVAEKRFREDLFWRLNVTRVHLPSLDERRDDIPALARHFCQRACARNGLGEIEISPWVICMLENREWRGNVRELRHVVETAAVRAVLQNAPLVMLEHLDTDEPDAQSANRASYRSALRAAQRHIVRHALTCSDGNVAETARRLGIARSYLHTLLRRLDLSPSSPRDGSASSDFTETELACA